MIILIKYAGRFLRVYVVFELGSEVYFVDVVSVNVLLSLCLM